MKKSIFVSRASAEKMVGMADAVLISLFDPEQGKPALTGEWKDILYLCCHDIDQVDDSDNAVAHGGYLEGPILFDEAMAKAVIEFIEKHDTVETFVIHCHAGISRSGAVAMFMGRCYNFVVFNEHVRVSDSYAIYNKRMYSLLFNQVMGYS